MEAVAEKKPSYGWLTCQHCGVRRQGIDVMKEHMDAAHADKVKVQGAKEVVPGVDLVPDDLVSQMDAIAATFNGMPTQVVKDAELEILQSFENGAMWRGKKLPEFVYLWTPNCRQVRVSSKRIWTLVAKKGFRMRPPTMEEYDRYWFHFTCPIPTCAINKKWCEWHQAYGRDSNHELHSADYMILDHLRTGGKIHRQYFEMHKDELAARYKTAFTAYMAEEERRETAAKKREEAA